jgi:hypothetical protein
MILGVETVLRIGNAVYPEQSTAGKARGAIPLNALNVTATR